MGDSLSYLEAPEREIEVTKRIPGEWLIIIVIVVISIMHYYYYYYFFLLALSLSFI